VNETANNEGEKIMTLKPWPNKEGFSFGEWDLFKREGYWQANFTPRGERYVSKSGKGKNWKEAMLNAKQVIND
jgi:hypothetical protein